MTKLVINPIYGKLDAVRKDSEILESTQSFHSFTGIAANNNMYVKFGDLTITVSDYVGKEFIAVIDFIQHNTSPYQERKVPHRYGKLSLQITAIWLKDNAYTVDAVLYDNYNIATSDIIIVETATSEFEVKFEFHFKIFTKKCRYFYSYRINQDDSKISFIATKNQTPQYYIPVGTQYNPILKTDCDCSLLKKQTIIASLDDETHGAIEIDDVLLSASTMVFKNGVILYPTQYILNTPTNGSIELDLLENDTITVLYSNSIKREDITVSLEDETLQKITITNSFNTVFAVFKNGAILYPTQYTITNNMISLTIQENDTITLLLL
ncbi:MAG: hypothetical protein M0R02_09335 [Bacteroidales bacterium]|nr:hypothetical protein [Bacteroidales bacterium]